MLVEKIDYFQRGSSSISTSATISFCWLCMLSASGRFGKKAQTGTFICRKESQAVSSYSQKTSTLWLAGCPDWHILVDFIVLSCSGKQ